MHSSKKKYHRSGVSFHKKDVEKIKNKTWLSVSNTERLTNKHQLMRRQGFSSVQKELQENEILALDRTKISDTAIRGCRILLVDEAHSKQRRHRTDYYISTHSAEWNEEFQAGSHVGYPRCITILPTSI